MAPYETNLAYDFSRFDRAAKLKKSAVADKPAQTPEKTVKPQTTLRGKIREMRGMDAQTDKIRLSRMTKLLLGSILCLTLAGFVIFNQAQLNEINYEIVKTERTIAALETEYTEKAQELEKSVNVRTAEQIARNEYGMVAADTAQMHYVTLPAQGQEAGTRSDGGFFASVGRFFEQVFAYISGN